MDTKQGLMEMPPGSLGRSSVFALAGGLVTSVAWNVLVGWHRKPASGRLNKVNMKQGLRERETKIKKKAGLCKWRQKSRKLKKQIKRSRYIYTPTFICTEVQWYLNREEGCNELMGWELRVGWELHGAGWWQGSESLWIIKSPLGQALLGISKKRKKEIQIAHSKIRD